jgi:cytochrome c553
MKKVMLALAFLGLATFATAQLQNPTTDVLGAHLNFGRGCAGCHAPHSGAAGNGANKSGKSTVSSAMLWGQDWGALAGQTITFANNTVEVLPPDMLDSDTDPNVKGTMPCLSCHDGNLATGAMMKNAVYETLPSTYGTQTIPTLLNSGSAGGNNVYAASHPVGLNAIFNCGSAYWNWDCTNTNGSISMNGPQSSQFVTDYGFFVSLQAYNNTATVTCTSCHNQHSMNAVKVSSRNSGQPAGVYATMFFIRGPYNPASTTPGSNQTAQFCRECHGSEGNEALNGNIATKF